MKNMAEVFYTEGKEIGKLQARIEIVKKLYVLGYSINSISETLEMPFEEVKDMLEKYKDV